MKVCVFNCIFLSRTLFRSMKIEFRTNNKLVLSILNIKEQNSRPIIPTFMNLIFIQDTIYYYYYTYIII